MKLYFCVQCQTDFDIEHLCLHLRQEKQNAEDEARRRTEEHDAWLRGYAPGLGARVTDPETSHIAAAECNAEGVQASILAAFKKYGPGTEEQVSEWTGIVRPSLSPQFAPMMRSGYIINLIDPDTGLNIKRRNTSGKLALVRGLPSQQETH